MNPGPNDLRLIATRATWRACATAHDVACAAENDASKEEAEQRRQAAEATWRSCEAALRDMAAIPADGLPGIAVKARTVLQEYDEGGGTMGGLAVARSLADDLERLAGPEPAPPGARGA